MNHPKDQSEPDPPDEPEARDQENAPTDPDPQRAGPSQDHTADADGERNTGASPRDDGTAAQPENAGERVEGLDPPRQTTNYYSYDGADGLQDSTGPAISSILTYDILGRIIPGTEAQGPPREGGDVPPA